MQKMIIGMIAACVLAVTTAQANAAVVPRGVAIKAIQTAKTAVGKACNGVASFVWRNKGAVAVGATATAVVARPDVFVGGVIALLYNPYVDTIMFWLLIILLIIIASRNCIRRIGRWRILPLVVVGLLLCTGVAEAGMIDCVSGPDAASACIARPPWLDIFMLVVLVFTWFF